MTITDIITRDERRGFSVEEQRFLISEYIQARKGELITVQEPPNHRSLFGVTEYPEYMHKLAFLFNYALMWFKENHVAN